MFFLLLRRVNITLVCLSCSLVEFLERRHFQARECINVRKRASGIVEALLFIVMSQHSVVIIGKEIIDFWFLFLAYLKFLFSYTELYEVLV